MKSASAALFPARWKYAAWLLADRLIIVLNDEKDDPEARANSASCEQPVTIKAIGNM